MKVKIKRLPHAYDLELPSYKTGGAVGLDLRACIDEPITLKPFEIALIPTGFAIEIPEGYEGQIRPRSGLALKGITVVNSPGTIDQDYRGEIKVILINLGKENFTIHRGDRIAQLVITPIQKVELIEVEELSETERGDCGFGSTGVR